MSQFNAKNLTYDKSEPAFLRRMKAGYDSQDGRNNIQHTRPSKSRLKTADGDEDEPVILDESGDIVERGVWEGMVRGEAGKNDQGKDVAEGGSKVEKDGNEKVGGGEVVEEREGQKVAEVGVSALKKRKAVKVINSTEDEREGKDLVMPKSSERSGFSERKPSTEKPKKKAKKIKLSFDEPE